MFSIVLKTSLTFEKGEYVTVVKVPGLFVFEKMAKKDPSSSNPADFARRRQMMLSMHKNECDFYKYIAKFIPETVPCVFETGACIPEENKVGYLHMEDLSVKGKNLDYYNCLSHGQIKSIVRHLAHFHKILLTTDESLWRGKLVTMGFLLMGVTSLFEDRVEKFKKIIRMKGTFVKLGINERTFSKLRSLLL